MNNLSVKLLQRLNKQNNNHGFTLIELLVVIIIIGILSAIALPSFLKQADKGKEAEPRMVLNGANKIQFGYYIENSEFTGDLGILELQNETDNYTYQTQNFVPELSLIIATPNNPTLRYFLGVTYIENDGTLYQRVCKAYQQDFLLDILPKFFDFKLDKNEINELDSEYCDGK
ncbi:MAG: prepilin-type N-terminal cleavage/methylation domain-containing protein [Okeania sp. SIO3I5]|uniref:type IV pilin-like G/H family protein n=1 Tax=Okeania sp. SIO3I5 TaxID=2607805 RepID=UPI0013B8FEB9|nr:type IV pilin-like G/H family protein [Okeania sp. SIO3I5]NEQ37211.1 prepilin-type N-terminal cleavage/methylation domain-containing protein [Okeania sp. SIO3I5]